MMENPYTPPAEIKDEEGERFWLLYACAFWLSAAITLLMAISAFGVVTMNLHYKLSTGNQLPTYIYSLFFLAPACAVGFGYSTIQWKRRLPRRATIAFLGSAVATFVGPRILLALLS